MSRFSGLVVAALITGAVGANGLVFGDPSWADVVRGSIAGASFSLTLALLLAISRCITRAPLESCGLGIALSAISGATAGGIWFASQSLPPSVFLCSVVGAVLGAGFGYVAWRRSEGEGTGTAQ